MAAWGKIGANRFACDACLCRDGPPPQPAAQTDFEKVASTDDENRTTRAVWLCSGGSPHQPAAPEVEDRGKVAAAGGEIRSPCDGWFCSGGPPHQQAAQADLGKAAALGGEIRSPGEVSLCSDRPQRQAQSAPAVADPERVAADGQTWPACRSDSFCLRGSEEENE